MSSWKPISLNLTSQKVQPVAVDITMLLAASSFTAPKRSRTDPRAADAFDAVATAYCNGATLFVPLPESHVDAAPFFFKLWKSDDAVRTVPNLEMEDSGFERAATAL